MQSKSNSHGVAETTAMVEHQVLSDWKTEIRVGDTLLDDRRVYVNIKRSYGHGQHADDKRQQPKNGPQTTEQSDIHHRSTAADDDQNNNKSQWAPRRCAAVPQQNAWRCISAELQRQPAANYSSDVRT